MKKCAVGQTRFTVTCLKTFASRIAVGDCRDGVLFYSYNEVGLNDTSGFLLNNDPVVSSNPGSSFVNCYQNLRKLELIYSDPAQRLVGDVALLNCETAVVSDRRGSISVLSCERLEGRHLFKC
jgi:splicing factor 3B subunit 3